MDLLKNIILMRIRRLTLRKDLQKLASIYINIGYIYMFSAYETLSDESKRQVYDSMGLTGDE
jgi:hypothetical protein